MHGTLNELIDEAIPEARSIWLRPEDLARLGELVEGGADEDELAAFLGGLFRRDCPLH